ncbi:MAG: DUF4157 domain-containing protein, partial [Chloroflexi bacterium]|nr:DUF4157 domain-containing protein [Chloroflexota bacterium]
MAGSECEACAQRTSGLQRQLTIGASNDPLEREADWVADRVLATRAPTTVSDAPFHIQRVAGQVSEGAKTAPASVERVLASPGRTLEPSLRQDMEQRFDHDFSGVRVHSDATAEQSARDTNARAFTVGRNVVFGRGEFAPRTVRGYHLLVHELTHVVQQSQSTASLIQRAPLDLFSDPDPLHDPSRLTDQQIESTDEYAIYMTMQPTPPLNQRVRPEEARLACRLLLRHMRDRQISMVASNADLLNWLHRARARLAVTTTAVGAVGTLDWVAASPGDVQTPATAA